MRGRHRRGGPPFPEETTLDRAEENCTTPSRLPALRESRISPRLPGLDERQSECTWETGEGRSRTQRPCPLPSCTRCRITIGTRASSTASSTRATTRRTRPTRSGGPSMKDYFLSSGDPRVAWEDTGFNGDGGIDCCGIVPFYRQQKFTRERPPSTYPAAPKCASSRLRRP